MEKKSIEYVLPEEIEKRSFEIIAAELAERPETTARGKGFHWNSMPWVFCIQISFPKQTSSQNLPCHVIIHSDMLVPSKVPALLLICMSHNVHLSPFSLKAVFWLF